MTTTTRTIHDVLSSDHERLDALYTELLEAADAGVDARTLRELWTTFETGLRQHMDVEEKLLFPGLGPEHAPDTETHLRDHGRLRELLEVLGVEVDLHLARAPEVHEFVDLLRAHAAREAATAYEAADREIDQRAYEALVEEIEGTGR